MKSQEWGLIYIAQVRTSDFVPLNKLFDPVITYINEWPADTESGLTRRVSVSENAAQSTPTAGGSPVQVDYLGTEFKPSTHTESSVITYINNYWNTYHKFKHSKVNESYMGGWREISSIQRDTWVTGPPFMVITARRNSEIRDAVSSCMRETSMVLTRWDWPLHRVAKSRSNPRSWPILEPKKLPPNTYLLSYSYLGAGCLLLP